MPEQVQALSNIFYYPPKECRSRGFGVSVWLQADSSEGKAKKKEHNRRRRLQTASADKGEDLVNEKPAGQGGKIIKDKEKVIRDKVTLSYIQMVVSFIEGRLVRFGEIFKMLSEIVRQHSIGKRRRFVYAFTYPSQKPP
jgi:hypothetical protein